MEGGGVPSVQDVWDWEVLPDEHRSFYAETRAASRGHGGGEVLADHETEEPIMPRPSQVDADNVDECKDIGVDVVPAGARSTQEDEEPAAPELLVSDGDGQEKFQACDDAKEVDDDGRQMAAAEEGESALPPHEFAAGEEEEGKKEEDGAPPECVVFSVGKLRVNAVGALCSFGVAAATVCVFLVGGRLQHQKQHQHQQQQKIQLQFLGDDKVVHQTSRLNQAMSSMMGAGASTRANISFGGFYDGF
ncbi:hypothetical protein CFC21_006448 [Triticum aestivum]|uniref:DUF6821 domain-containing protein n=3 Tax=Triticum TaxID=4564 RepID=A0A9R0QRQ4_TRITD|nr:hypothetical protein CFC21_006448 [Triticum aestivum]VAH16460.1 unnamed protein product [Triticum turgidum subsp. durum]